jgi:hypothetical protein
MGELDAHAQKIILYFKPVAYITMVESRDIKISIKRENQEKNAERLHKEVNVQDMRRLNELVDGSRIK